MDSHLPWLVAFGGRPGIINLIDIIDVIITIINIQPGQWLVVAGRAGPAAFFSLCFPAACGRCSIRARSPLRRHWAQVVQMEGDSRRLPRCAGGQLNLWPELDQLEQWIELRALSVSVSALPTCALPPPRERTFWRMSTSKGVDWGAELLVFQGEGCS